MILIFDLDDTLYPEIEYVKSGFKAVSVYLSKAHNINSNLIYDDMMLHLTNEGRGLIFNNVLKKINCFSASEVKKCISVYRNHNPRIKIFKEANRCLNRFNDYKKYIITDGNVIVQRKKINSLNIKQRFIKTIPTYQYGRKYSKPSTLCFKKIIKWENCKFSSLIYVGDNPNKDFINIKKEGINTIRVLTGPFRNTFLDKEFEADYMIKSLDELTVNFLKKIKYGNR